MAKPVLKQFGDLTEQDFDSHPVWVSCHIEDYDESWYDDTDEETFRPWDGELPVDPSRAEYLIRASATLNDGRTLGAFLSPTVGEGDIRLMQPHIFVGRTMFWFWGGMIGTPQSVRDDFFAALGADSNDVFPITFSGVESLAIGAISATIPGWMPDTVPDDSSSPPS